MNDFQVEPAMISFGLRKDGRSRRFRAVCFIACREQIDYRGAPVFTADGKLVGMVRDSILLEGESAWRPIVTSLIPALGFLAKTK